MNVIKNAIKDIESELDGIENIKAVFTSYTDNNFEYDITLIKIKVL